MRKKIITVSICSLLLLEGGGITPVPVYGAANQPAVILNNATLKLNDEVRPYLDGKMVMMPVRLTGEGLGYEVSYIKAQNSLQLTGNEHTYVLKLDESTVTVDGKVKLAIDGKAVLKRDRIYVPLAYFSALGMITSYDSAANLAAVSTPQKYADHVAGLLSTGQYMELWQSVFNKEVQQALPVLKLQSVWEMLVGTYGTFVRLDTAAASSADGYTVIQVPIVFAQSSLKMSVTVDGSGRLAGLLFTPIAPADDMELPAGLKEEETIVGAGTAHPLKGTLTLPENASGLLPSVVLVHGSGSSDRDETVFGYKTFRDLAWGLAKQGIAVLRYDKRTYTFAQQYAGEASAGLTVKEETVEDAVLAAKLLKQDSRLDPGRVYLAGHSLGGMLAPRIDAAGGNVAGLILLAGSPRKLWEIVYDQNMAGIQAMSDSDPRKAQNAALVDAELQKAKALSSMSAQQAAQAEPVLGLPASYLLEMQQQDTAELAAKLTKPVLVLQGADDFQVYADKDFVQWKEVLKHNPSAEFKLYPGLNHFFVDYDGKGAGTLEEYYVPGRVDDQVITDIGAWIGRQK